MSAANEPLDRRVFGTDGVEGGSSIDFEWRKSRPWLVVGSKVEFCKKDMVDKAVKPFTEDVAVLRVDSMRR